MYVKIKKAKLSISTEDKDFPFLKIPKVNFNNYNKDILFLRYTIHALRSLDINIVCLRVCRTCL